MVYSAHDPRTPEKPPLSDPRGHEVTAAVTPLPRRADWCAASRAGCALLDDGPPESDQCLL